MSKFTLQCLFSKGASLKERKQRERERKTEPSWVGEEESSKVGWAELKEGTNQLTPPQGGSRKVGNERERVSGRGVFLLLSQCNYAKD